MEGQLLKLCLFTFLFGLINAVMYELERPFANINKPEARFTPWLNADKLGYVGDFENVARQEFAEQRSGECRLPCKYPEATRVRIVKHRDNPVLSDWILENCLHLDWKQEWFRTEGYYCVSYQQRDPKITTRCTGDGPKATKCREYLGEDCECPDTEVQFLCPGTLDDMTKYCSSKGLTLKEHNGGASTSKSGVNDVTERGLEEKSHMDISDILINLIQDRKDEAIVKRKLKESESEEKENVAQQGEIVDKKEEVVDKKEERVLKDLLAQLL